MFDLSRIPLSQGFRVLASTIILGLARDDPIDQWSFWLDELFHYFLNFHQHYLFYWFLHIYGLDACLGAHLLGGFEIRKEVSRLDDYLFVGF